MNKAPRLVRMRYVPHHMKPPLRVRIRKAIFGHVEARRDGDVYVPPRWYRNLTGMKRP